MRRFGTWALVRCSSRISSVDQLLDDSHPPHPHSALQSAQLPVGKLAITACLQSLQHHFGFHVRPFLQPAQQDRPDFGKRIWPGPPPVSRLWLLPMSRPHFTGAPCCCQTTYKSRNIRYHYLRCSVLTERHHCVLCIPNMLQQKHGIERFHLLFQHFLGLGWNILSHQQSPIWRVGQLILLVNSRTLSVFGFQFERRLEEVCVQSRSLLDTAQRRGRSKAL